MFRFRSRGAHCDYHVASAASTAKPPGETKALLVVATCDLTFSCAPAAANDLTCRLDLAFIGLALSSETDGESNSEREGEPLEIERDKFARSPAPRRTDKRTQPTGALPLYTDSLLL